MRNKHKLLLVILLLATLGSLLLATSSTNAAPADDFDYAITLNITNTSSENMTNPVLRIPISQYTPIDQGAFSITLANTSVFEYSYAIPVPIANMKNSSVTNYPIKIGPVDTEFLINRGWATASGNETRWVTSDKSTLLNFWLEDVPNGWNSTETYYWVEGSLTALGNTTWYMMIDADLTQVASSSTTSIFQLFDHFDDASLNTTLWDETGTVSESGTTVVISGAPERISSDISWNSSIAMRTYAKMATYAGANTGTWLGFQDAGLDICRFTNYNAVTHKTAIMTHNGVSSTKIAPISRFPVNSYATWDVMWRATDGDNHPAWARFDINNVNLYKDADYGSPIWSNVPTTSSTLDFYSAGNIALTLDYVMVRDYISPEPIANFPYLTQDLETVFLNDGCYNWPYDLTFTKHGNSTELDFYIDDHTLSSIYATEAWVEYDGNVAINETVVITLWFGDESQTSRLAAWNGTNTFDFYDGFETGEPYANGDWTETAGTWGTSDQQRGVYAGGKYGFSRSYNVFNTSYGFGMLTLEASWQGDATIQNPAPWNHTLLTSQDGNWWRRWGNVLQIESEWAHQASTYPSTVWWGNGSNGFDANTLYCLISGNNWTDADGAAWLAKSTDEGYHWTIMNDGDPLFTEDDLIGSITNFWAGDLVYKSPNYYLFCSGRISGSGYAHFFANSTVLESTFEYNDTILETGAALVEDTDLTLHGSTWVLNYEGYLPDLTARYMTCADADFDLTMNSSDWTDQGDVTSLDGSRFQEGWWGVVETTTTHPNYDYYGAFWATGEDGDVDRFAINYMASGYTSNPTNNSWTKINVDKELGQTNTASSVMLAHVTSGNYSNFELIGEMSVSTNVQAGILFRYLDTNNYMNVVAQADALKLNVKFEGGDSWPESEALAEHYVLNQMYRIRVRSHGDDYDVAMSTGGEEWETIFTGTETDLAPNGSIGLYNYGAAGYWDNLRVLDWYGEQPTVTQETDITVTTNAATNILATTATLNGEASGSLAQNRGFAWGESSEGEPSSSTSPSASNYDSSWSEAIGASPVTHNVTSLTPATIYYYRCAYQMANYPYSWFWGDEVSFFTEPVEPNTFVAVDGTGESIDITWVKGTGAQNTEIWGKNGSYPSTRGDGSLTYNSTGTSTTDNSPSNGDQWCYRAWSFATDSGLWQYSDTYDQDCATVNISTPTVVTNAATSVEETFATMNGNITVAEVNATTRGFDWDIDSGVPYTFNWTEAGSFGTGTFSHNATGLTEGELYYFRAKATNLAGQGNGSELMFLTKPLEPTVLLNTSRTSTSIAMAWTGAVSADRYIVRYDTSAFPTTPTSGTLTCNTSSTTCNSTPLSSGQLYYFSVWSWCTEGGLSQYSDAYDTMSNYTLPADCTNFDAYNPSSSAIDLSWNKGAGGDTSHIRRGANGSYPANVSDGTQVYFNTGTFTTDSPLSANESYCYRIWAYDSDSGYYSSGYDQDCETTLVAGATPTPTPTPTGNVSGIDLEVRGNLRMLGLVLLPIGLMAIGFWQKKTWVMMMAGISFIGLGAYGLIDAEGTWGSSMIVGAASILFAVAVLIYATMRMREAPEPDVDVPLDVSYEQELRDERKQREEERKERKGDLL